MHSFDEIRSALDSNHFFLEYLPTISLSNQRCVGAEALIRWRRGNEVVMPMDFIPAVENTPLSGAITYWVFDRVAVELKPWMQEHDDVRISINVPPEVLGRGGLRYAAMKSGLHEVPDKLALEITERGLPDTLGVAAMREVAHSKVLLVLDDVSTTDVGLFVLSRVPAHALKLEKTFADDMLRPEWTPQRIANIAAMIGSSSITVIAEGVETDAQLEILRDAGVQYAQGWYFSRSLPAAEFIAYHAAHQ